MNQNTALQAYSDSEDYTLGEDVREGDREFVSFNGKHGCFISANDKDNLSLRELEGVILRTDLPSRAYFVRQGEQSELRCSSADGLLPRDVAKAVAAGCGPSCASCPYHDWLRNGDTLTPPACKLSINLLLASPIELAEQEPVLIALRVGGSSTTVLRSFLTLLNKRRQAEHPARPPFAYLVRLTTEHKRIEGRGIDYFVLKPELRGEVPHALWPAYAALHRSQSARIAAAKTAAEAYEQDVLRTYAPRLAPDDPQAPGASDALPFERPAAASSGYEHWKAKAGF